jgi:predicted HTH domain antitoxin
MTISFELPQSIEQQVGADGADLNREAQEAYLVELFRRRKISQHQLAEALGLTRVEADGVLKKHEVWLELTPEEFRFGK